MSRSIPPDVVDAIAQQSLARQAVEAQISRWGTPVLQVHGDTALPALPALPARGMVHITGSDFPNAGTITLPLPTAGMVYSFSVVEALVADVTIHAGRAHMRGTSHSMSGTAVASPLTAARSTSFVFTRHSRLGDRLTCTADPTTNGWICLSMTGLAVTSYVV